MTRVTHHTGLALLTGFALTLMLAGCGIIGGSSSGGGGQDPESGSGTQANPYVILEGTKYKFDVPSFTEFLSREDLYFEIVPDSSSSYSATLKGSADLMLRLRDVSDSVIAECDETDSGTEKCDSADIGLTLTAGTTYYLTVFNWDEKQVSATLIFRAN